MESYPLNAYAKRTVGGTEEKEQDGQSFHEEGAQHMETSLPEAEQQQESHYAEMWAVMAMLPPRWLLPKNPQ